MGQTGLKIHSWWQTRCFRHFRYFFVVLHNKFTKIWKHNWLFRVLVVFNILHFKPNGPKLANSTCKTQICTVCHIRSFCLPNQNQWRAKWRNCFYRKGESENCQFNKLEIISNEFGKNTVRNILLWLISNWNWRKFK